MKKFEPDFSQFEKVLKKSRPDRPVFFEYYVDPAVACPEEDHLNPSISDKNEAIAEKDIRVFKACNADYATLRIENYGFNFVHANIHEAKTISLNEGHSIRNRSDFEKYPWPDLSKADYDVLSRSEKYLPSGMKIMMDAPMGLLENLIRLIGYEDLCFMLFEDPDLVQDITDKVGCILLEHYKRIAEYPSVMVGMINDDWGFNTQPMLNPDQMKQYIKPWHIKFAKALHDKNKYAVMHSCGQLSTLYEDIIEDIKMDGKHSYEDNIRPVESFYDEYKKRIAILGGLDIDYLCRRSPEEIYNRSKAMLERSQTHGAYALGSGNSIPYYIPRASFMAMQKALTD